MIEFKWPNHYYFIILVLVNLKARYVCGDVGFQPITEIGLVEFFKTSYNGSLDNTA